MHSSLCFFLGLAAWYYQDGRYEWFKRFIGTWKPDWNLGHTYAANVAPRMPDDILGVKVIPAENWIYEAGIGQVKARKWLPPWIMTKNTPPMPPRERAYDKIAFRTKIAPDSAYLLLDGLSGFGMAHADANNIVQFYDKGRVWLFPAGYMTYALPEHNVVVVMRDGQGGIAEVPMLADLELSADMSRFGAVRSTLHNYNGTDWARNILWAKDRYFLVIDEVVAVAAGAYVLQGWWKAGGTLEGRRLQSDGEVRFQLVSLDDSTLSQTISRRGQAQLRTSQTGVLRAGDQRVFMSLLQCTAAPHTEAVDARRLAPSAVALRGGAGEYEVLGSRPLMDSDELEVAGELYWLHSDGFSVLAGTALTCGTRLFESEDSVTMECDLRRGRARVDVKEDTRLALLTGPGGEVRCDGRLLQTRLRNDGLLSFEVPAGEHRVRFPALAAAQLVPIQRALGAAWERAEVPPTPPPGLQADAPEMAELWRWDSQGDTRTRTRVLLHADLDGDGRDELLVGTEDQVLRCFDGKGKLLWDFTTEQRLCSAWVGDLRGDGELAILVGTGNAAGGHASATLGAAIYILDVQGNETARIPSPASPEDDSFGSRIGALECILGLDTDGDGIKEIIVSSSNWYVFSLRLDGEMMWAAADYARGPSNLQTHDITGDGKQEIVSTTLFQTNVFSLDGHRLFTVGTAGPGLAVGDVDGDGVVEVASGSLKGQVSLAKYEGTSDGSGIEPVWSFDTGSPVEALGLGDLTGDGSEQILACSRNSIVYAFNADGSILWTRALGEGVRALKVVDLDGDGTPEIICGTAAGQVFVLSGNGNILAQAQVAGLVRFVAVADIDGDGRLEVIAVTDGPGLYAVRWLR